MQAKFLKSIVEYLTNKQSVPIVDLLLGKKDSNEFLIAKKLGLTINQTRNILYKLSDCGLVSFIRKKDRRKGWYIYFWTLNIYQSLNLLQKRLEEELSNLDAQLRTRKERRYYICNTCSLEVNEETALLNDFVCPECEQIYELADNTEITQKLEREIIKIKKEIELVAFEKEKEGEKLEKKKARKIKKSEEELKEKRRKDREIRYKLRKKTEKKLMRAKISKKKKLPKSKKSKKKEKKSQKKFQKIKKSKEKPHKKQPKKKISKSSSKSKLKKRK